MNNQWLSWCACVPVLACIGTVQGQSSPQAQARAYAAASAPVAGPPQAPLIGFDTAYRRGATRAGESMPVYPGSARPDETPPWASVVTLPPEVRLGPPGRSHHALSLRSEASTQALRSMGFDVIDCTTRLRLPSRFRQRTVNADGGFEAAAQVSWQCRF